jgi:hypothetical protein
VTGPSRSRCRRPRCLPPNEHGNIGGAGGIPVLLTLPGQFLLKDVVPIGVAVWLLGESLGARDGAPRLGPRNRCRVRADQQSSMTKVAIPLSCGMSLAECIERVETERITAATEAARRRVADAFAIPVAGGMACFVERGSPFNKIVGLGFGGMPSGTALTEIEQAFAAHGVATQVELAQLAAPQIAALLMGRAIGSPRSKTCSAVGYAAYQNR